MWFKSFIKEVFFLCQMQKEIEKIELEVVERIYKLFLEKYSGNKSAFSRVSACRESTIRRIFRHEQGITINLLLRMAKALDTTVSDLMKDLYIEKEI
jgi:hypothetical protein